MNQEAIKNRLFQRGQQKFDDPKSPIIFTGHANADKLLNDLEQFPHAYVLACIMDRQIKAEKAWLIPYRFYEKLGDFSMESLLAQSEADIYQHMTEPVPLHRFNKDMSRYFHLAVLHISERYNNDASHIWSNNPSSATVVTRFWEFAGVGQKISTMATNILARDFKIHFSNYTAIDISVDVHVRRVFTRLGLVPPNADSFIITYKAREMNPKYPGIFDLPAFEIGRNWCRPRQPACHDCFMNDICPKIDIHLN